MRKNKVYSDPRWSWHTYVIRYEENGVKYREYYTCVNVNMLWAICKSLKRVNYTYECLDTDGIRY